MDIFAGLVVAWLVFSAGMLVAWTVERRTGNAGWVDVVWTVSLALGAVAGTALAIALGTPSDAGRVGAAGLLLFAWTARLGGHLASRSSRIGDDPRYAKLRAEWGPDASRRLGFLLQAQALLSLPLVLSLILAATVPVPTTLASILPGIAMSAAGLLIGWRADRDLAAFKRNASGLCRTGLWRYSRHPNYFGEVVFWAGVALLSWQWGWVGWLAALGPITIYLLLRFVSGVPPLEDHLASRYGADFDAYRATTPAIFPRPGRPKAPSQA